MSAPPSPLPPLPYMIYEHETTLRAVKPPMHSHHIAFINDVSIRGGGGRICGMGVQNCPNLQTSPFRQLAFKKLNCVQNTVPLFGLGAEILDKLLAPVIFVISYLATLQQLCYLIHQIRYIETF